MTNKEKPMTNEMPRTYQCKKNRAKTARKKLIKEAAAYRKERSNMQKEFAKMSNKVFKVVYNKVGAMGAGIMNSQTYNEMVKYLTRQEHRDLKVKWGVLKAEKA